MAWLQTRDADAAVGLAAWPRRGQPTTLSGYGADSEYGRLESVLLAAPDQLDLVACNSVSRESLRLGRKAQ